MPGKVIVLLVLVVSVQFIWPLTADGSPVTPLIYQLMYAPLRVVGIVLTRNR